LKTGEFHRILNYIMGFILLALWVSILVTCGIAGAVAWALAKLLFAPIGVILVLVNLTLLINSLVRKTEAAPKAILLRREY
jgi:uncharacterized membrane protein YtjA (UPF0391 family)